MAYCGGYSWCCQTTEESCCTGTDHLTFSWDLGIPMSTIQTPLEPLTQLLVMTVHKYSTVIKQHEPSTNTMVITKTATPPGSISTTLFTKTDALPSSVNSQSSSTFHTTRSHVSNLDRKTSVIPENSQLQMNETTLKQSASAPSNFFAGPESSPIPSTTHSAGNDPTIPPSASTPAAKNLTPKTGVGLGVGLCVFLVAIVIGIVAWGVRKHRRKALRTRKLKISRPISVKTIPMFEVANTDWELPVDREMPTEMSANRRTGRSWV